ncbi:MAG: hypothetical protein IJ316_05070 [Clostridia bacterium]|nr:hypothetical protein [Clostridia bacterium]
MLRFFTLFTIGGTGYFLIEILWRGYSHWTMFVLGGLCFYSLFSIFPLMHDVPIIVKALTGGAIITVMEFVTGCIVNLLLDWNVWNYSDAPFNVLGQICLPYTILWSLLCIPIAYLCLFVEQHIG